METGKEFLELSVVTNAYYAKVDALIEALDDHQKGAFKEALRRNKENYIKHYGTVLDEELLHMVDLLFQ